MGSRRVSLVDLGRAIGDGWCAFGRGAVRGEALLVPGGGLGIDGEPFPDMNFGYVFGPDGVGEAVRHVEHEYVVERASDVDGVMDAADVLGDAYEIPPEWVRSLLGPTFPDLPSADVFLTRREGRALAAAARRWASTPWGHGRPIAAVGLRPRRSPPHSTITCAPAPISLACSPPPPRSRSMRVWALP